jgi:hypothetical protein
MRGVDAAQHFVGNLGVAGLVCSHEAHAIAAQEGGNAVAKKKDREEKKNYSLADGSPPRRPVASSCGQFRSGRFQISFHVQRFSSSVFFKAGELSGRKNELGFGQSAWGSTWPGYGLHVLKTRNCTRVSAGTRLTDSREISSGRTGSLPDGRIQAFSEMKMQLDSGKLKA